MVKDIIIIRPPNKLDMPLDDRDIMYDALQRKFREVYLLIILWDENETDKTTFEIIKYENN
jgi:hypothetical protein